MGLWKDNRRSWEYSAAECKRLVKHFKGLRPYEVRGTINLNETRNIIVRLTEPMALLAQKMIASIAVNEEQIQGAGAGGSDPRRTRKPAFCAEREPRVYRGRPASYRLHQRGLRRVPQRRRRERRDGYHLQDDVSPSLLPRLGQAPDQGRSATAVLRGYEWSWGVWVRPQLDGPHAHLLRIPAHNVQASRRGRRWRTCQQRHHDAAEARGDPDEGRGHQRVPARARSRGNDRDPVRLLPQAARHHALQRRNARVH